MAPLPVSLRRVSHWFLLSWLQGLINVVFILRIGTKCSRTTQKGYLTIFVDMASLTLHIVVIEDLTPQTFIDAFTRFTGSP